MFLGGSLVMGMGKCLCWELGEWDGVICLFGGGNGVGIVYLFGGRVWKFEGLEFYQSSSDY